MTTSWGGGKVMFDQIEVAIRNRINLAELVRGDPAHGVNQSEYRGKIQGLKDAMGIIEHFRDVWVGSGEEM